MRSEGQVRFITISSKVQIGAAALAVSVLSVWGGTMAYAGWSQYQASADRETLLMREAKVADAEERHAAYSGNVEQVAEDLQRRQQFIEDMVASLPSDLKSDAPVSDSSSETTKMVDKISVAFPEAAALARMEARQIAFVERLTRFADYRSQRAEDALRTLGVDPRGVLRDAERAAMGGPLEALTTDRDGRIDPRFERLGLSLARMSALERSLERVPQYQPANAALSSPFGYRRDPFTGRGAMHSGLDFKGPKGTEIAAAAKGRVSFAGWRGGYGKTIEITHGNGIMTRYAHLSSLGVAVGDTVDAGDRIGGMGSTGRSTGSHLHFEVRMNGEAKNPRTFLEQAPNVLEEVRRLPAPRR